MMDLHRSQILKDIGITRWQKRDQNLRLPMPSCRMGDRSFILLEKPVESPEIIKILEGMIKVLDLSADDYSISWIEVQSDLKPKQWCQIIENLYPETVLIMGASLGASMKAVASDKLQFNMYITAHPEHLMRYPEGKRQAYEELLKLKAKLHSTHHKVMLQNKT